MNAILNNKHYFYLLLTILGGGLTFYFALLGIIEHKGNFDSIEFITSTWTDNYYAKSLSFDFWTGTIAGTFFYTLGGTSAKNEKSLAISIPDCIHCLCIRLPLIFVHKRTSFEKTGIKNTTHNILIFSRKEKAQS